MVQFFILRSRVDRKYLATAEDREFTVYEMINFTKDNIESICQNSHQYNTRKHTMVDQYNLEINKY